MARDSRVLMQSFISWTLGIILVLLSLVNFFSMRLIERIILILIGIFVIIVF